MSIVLAGLSALMYGVGDFCGGLATRKNPVHVVLVYSQLVGLLLALGFAFMLGQPFPSPADAAWGAVAGICGAAGLAALYSALATTPVAIASPVAAVTGAAIPVLLGVATGERPDALAWVGMALAVAAMVLLTAGRADKKKAGAVRRAVVLGAAAGIAFGFFFFAISRTSHASGLWPLVSARVATIIIVGIFVLASGKSLLPGGPGFPIALLSGCLDMGANIAFLLSARLGLLSLTAVVSSSLYPAPTVFLAMLIFRERLTALRAAGLVVACAAVAFISL
jgi:drug/metabolite transporter (DMT)-like permease